MYPWSDQGGRCGAALLAHQASFGSVVRTPLPPWCLDTLKFVQLPPRGDVSVGLSSSTKNSAEYEGRYPPSLARKLALVGNGSLPPIVPISLITTDVALTRADDKNTVASIASTWALVAGSARIELRDRLLQMHRQRPAPFAEHAGQDMHLTKSRLVDRPSFRTVKCLEMRVVTSGVDRVGPEAEGLSLTEKEEFGGIVKPLDVPLLDAPSPTDAGFRVLTSTPAKIRDRLIQTHREHARSSAREKGNEVESQSEAEESHDSEAVCVIQDPRLNKSSSIQNIGLPLAHSPKKRHDSHGNTNIAVNSGSDKGNSIYVVWPRLRSRLLTSCYLYSHEGSRSSREAGNQQR
ncbi:hypothetical protein BDN71DRAFT_1095812 [Pleurotus eryngii]|uniref:Uncharacterized protein n=1 Tax=Pleurotus eryngii TaxID=5323 RepID=A0A9P5ZTZ1_PLEER|nr:hypothetical protein BDN71DRAFT_1095812 [Pleurotus eryngii]